MQNGQDFDAVSQDPIVDHYKGTSAAGRLARPATARRTVRAGRLVVPRGTRPEPRIDRQGRASGDRNQSRAAITSSTASGRRNTGRLTSDRPAEHLTCSQGTAPPGSASAAIRRVSTSVRCHSAIATSSAPPRLSQISPMRFRRSEALSRSIPNCCKVEFMGVAPPPEDSTPRLYHRGPVNARQRGPNAQGPIGRPPSIVALRRTKRDARVAADRDVREALAGRSLAGDLAIAASAAPRPPISGSERQGGFRLPFPL